MKDHVTINALAPAHSHTLVLVTIEYSILYILEIPEGSQRYPRGIPEGSQRDPRGSCGNLWHVPLAPFPMAFVAATTSKEGEKGNEAAV